MAAPTGYPSWVYNLTQPAQVVQNVAQFNALPGPGVWAAAPYPPSAVTIPTDSLTTGTGTYTATDTRLQQLLIEARILNQYFAQANPGLDDPMVLRADVVLTDQSLTS